MTIEVQEDEQNQELAVSEQLDDGFNDESQDGQKMVPLAAVLATRKKLQDAEMRAIKAEASNQAYQDYMSKLGEKQVSEPEDDPNGLVEKQDLRDSTAHTKREILETLYQDMNPDAVLKINKYLKPILEKKPWLAQSVDTAQNRYSRAYEIVQDYLHLVEDKSQTKTSSIDGRRIVENAHKPRSPTEFGKSAKPVGAEYLKSIQGKKEFREYRQKVLQGET